VRRLSDTLDRQGSAEERCVVASADSVDVSEARDGARFDVHVKPRASRSALLGVREGALDLAVTAPPVEGEANAAVCELVAKALGLKARDVEIAAGATGRNKVVCVHGLAAGEVAARITAALASKRGK
jgi:uncharacterized protein (TIGR00251 family)